MNKLSKKAEFGYDLRFDFFFSIQLLLDENSRIHEEWKIEAKKTLGSAFINKLGEISFSSEYWALFADIFEKESFITSFEKLIAKLKKIDLETLQFRVLEGTFHNNEISHDLIKQKIDLKQALSEVPKEKQEWLSYIGLYPYDKNSKLAKSLSELIHKPENYQKKIVNLLTDYWNLYFKNINQNIISDLEKSVREKERLFNVLSFDEFAVKTHLRITVDDDKEEIKAIRGGYKVKYKEIEKLYFSPSIFNEKRLWTAFCGENKKTKTTVYFPYFDNEISIGKYQKFGTEFLQIDSYLILKTLGDNTRFAIAKLIAKDKITAVEISKNLDLTKATVSHHISLFRQAGLLIEEPIKGAIHLSLNKNILENINKFVIRELYGKDKN